MNLRHWRTFLISLAIVAVIGMAMPRASSEMSDASHTAGPIEVEVRPWRFASLPADGRVAPGLYFAGRRATDFARSALRRAFRLGFVGGRRSYAGRK